MKLFPVLASINQGFANKQAIMILDKVDLSHIASAFRLRGYSSCSPARPDAASRERDMFERAKQRRRADAEQARMKLAKKDARLRIRQFEDQRRKEDFEICTPKPSSETTEVDSGVFVFEDPKTTASNAEIVSKIVSSDAQTTRFVVSGYPDKDSSVVYQFHDEPSYLGYFSLEVSHE
ncbi:hypothetical protein D6D01_09877 [Aureobasidium pullulans]|uniref:Uncharacterized protein n=1 Tax=Aureobasidium pullulans TaxID=5580 RepID=A0A4S9JUI3_AURPU|nr:hypothetical protein D6D01_09877 [Aureobasidium pullulans]